MGIQRYYSGMQNQLELRRVLRVRKTGTVSSQDAVVTEDGQQYRIDLVQSVQDVYPPCVDLTLAVPKQIFDVSKLDTSARGETL